MESDRAPTVDEVLDAMLAALFVCWNDEEYEYLVRDATWGKKVVRATGRWDSYYVEEYADALRLLGQMGRVRITEDDGNRHVVAVPNTQGDNNGDST